MKNPLRKQGGFTIIEVLIVLAIAGLILLIVFLAVPSLQRNNRNTQRKNDASQLLGAVSEHLSNNNGQLPIVDDTDFSVTFASSSPKMGYYQTPECVEYDYSAGARTPTAPTANSGCTSPATDQVKIYNNSKCADATTATATGATTRSIVAMYTIETSNGTTTQCVES